jgi:hypothetical protein
MSNQIERTLYNRTDIHILWGNPLGNDWGAKYSLITNTPLAFKILTDYFHVCRRNDKPLPKHLNS